MLYCINDIDTALTFHTIAGAPIERATMKHVSRYVSLCNSFLGRKTTDENNWWVRRHKILIIKKICIVYRVRGFMVLWIFGKKRLPLVTQYYKFAIVFFHNQIYFKIINFKSFRSNGTGPIYM